MRVSWLVGLGVVTGLLLGEAGSAHALKPAKHLALAVAACGKAGLPAPFCKRIGQAAFDTDAHEWDLLAAHAQREEGEDRCAGADAAIDRVDALAREAIDRHRAGDDGTAADLFGRAIHTIQDECAHHGMTNPEHAHFSLQATCSSADVNPDIQPAALACADTQTTAALRAIADALADAPRVGLAGVCPPDYNGGDGNGRTDTCDKTVMPGPIAACDFLASHTRRRGRQDAEHAGLPRRLGPGPDRGRRRRQGRGGGLDRTPD
jgi:hypothetical protein